MPAERRLLPIYLFGVFIGALDTNVLGPALPLVAHSFSTTLAWTAWTITAYTAAYIASTVLAGPGGDRVGRRTFFLVGIALFGAASLLAALSGNLPLFLVARTLQGAGAGLVYPNAQAEGMRAFPEEKRGMALGLFGAVFGLAAIIGPNLGGLLAQAFGWPAIFLVNVPLAVIVLGLGRRLPKTEADHPGGLPDVFGGVAFSLTLVFLLLALSAASVLSVVWLMAALVSGITFSLRQRRAATPFLDTAPLKTSSGAFMMAAAGIIGLDLAAAVFVPALAQQELHFSVLLSGVALMPAAVVGAVLAGAAGVLVDRLGARRVLQVGLAAAGVGGVLIALPDLTVVRFVIAMAFFGFGTAFTLGAPINRLATLLYRKDQLGEALSLVAVARAVGLMVGPVVFGLMITNSGFSAPFWLLAVVSALGVMLLFQVPNWLQPSQVAS